MSGLSVVGELACCYHYGGASCVEVWTDSDVPVYNSVMSWAVVFGS